MGMKGLALAQNPGFVPPPTSAAGVECAIAAFGVVEATPEVLPTLRKKPLPLGSRELPANFFKYADDQTVVALSAVLRAAQDYNLGGYDFTDWAVVAAPRFLGRTYLVSGFERFHRQGAPAVSPLIVPYLSLHVVSGTISLALQSHGLNLGVGGGEGGLVEALATSLVIVAEHRPPGVWVVLTEWDPEPTADDKGRPINGPSVCRAVVLALIPDAQEEHFRLRFSARPMAIPKFDLPRPTLASLAAALLQPGEAGPRGSWGIPLDWGGSLEITQAGADPSVLPGGSASSAAA
jgi:hypothetical protein